LAKEVAVSISKKMQAAGRIMVKVQQGFLFYLLLVLTLAMLAEIMSRFFLNKSIFGLSDFVGYTSVWLYAIGASYATYERSHIKAEFLGVFLRSTRSLHFSRLVAASISAGMSAIFTKWSYDLCVYSIQVQEKTHAYPVPKVIFQASFLVGAFIMTIYFLWEAFSCFIRLRDNAPHLPSETL
jgi:TRAP-type C4-dicarboxylate transport system permease small subunit